MKTFLFFFSLFSLLSLSSPYSMTLHPSPICLNDSVEGEKQRKEIPFSGEGFNGPPQIICSFFMEKVLMDRNSLHVAPGRNGISGISRFHSHYTRTFSNRQKLFSGPAKIISPTLLHCPLREFFSSCEDTKGNRLKEKIEVVITRKKSNINLANPIEIEAVNPFCPIVNKSRENPVFSETIWEDKRGCSSLLCQEIAKESKQQQEEGRGEERKGEREEGEGEVESELVVAHCQESLEWLFPDFEYFDKITIISKCRSPPRNLQSNPKINILEMENIGSCDGAYLHHIITRWNNLAKKTIFIKAFSQKVLGIPQKTHTPTHFKNANISSILLLKHLFEEGEGEGIEREWSLSRAKGFEAPGFVCGFPVHKVDTMFSIPMYANSQKKRSLHDLDMFGGDFGMYLEHLVGFVPDITTFCPAGYFGATKKAIHSQPKAFYKAMHSLQFSAREEVDHFIERTWYYFLTRKDPVNCI